MSTTNNTVVAGIYPLKSFFLGAIGESTTNWEKFPNQLIEYWLTENIDFDLFKINGEYHIRLNADLTNYTPMPAALAEYTKTENKVWIESTSKEEIVNIPDGAQKQTDWNNFLTAKGVTPTEIADSFYDGSLATIERKLAEAKRDYYLKYGEYPALATKITYTVKQS